MPVDTARAGGRGASIASPMIASPMHSRTKLPRRSRVARRPHAHRTAPIVQQSRLCVLCGLYGLCAACVVLCVVCRVCCVLCVLCLFCVAFLEYAVCCVCCVYCVLHVLRVVCSVCVVCVFRVLYVLCSKCSVLSFEFRFKTFLDLCPSYAICVRASLVCCLHMDVSI